MSWHTLTNLTQGQLVTETHMDNIRENIEYLGDNIEIGGTAAKNLSGATSASQMATGLYTGDGNATQAITGVGFQPDYMRIYRQDTTALDAHKSDQDGTKTHLGGAPTWEDDHIISLNSDGFTVGDGTPSSNLVNVNTIVYAYIAWKV
jgi:hypothetical protein